MRRNVTRRARQDSGRHTASGGIDPRVRGVVAHILQRLAMAHVSIVRARYDLGQLVHALRYSDARAFGTNAVDTLASWLGIDSSALRRWARVTEVIPPDELDGICCARTPRGMPLTWTHLEKLALERSTTRRREQAQLAIREDWSVATLASSVRRSQRPHPILCLPRKTC
jgi:hypothetical protein